MTTGLTFEYYSTFAPVAGAFLADEPASGPMSAYCTTKTLRSIDRGYFIYSTRQGTPSSRRTRSK